MINIAASAAATFFTRWFVYTLERNSQLKDPYLTTSLAMIGCTAGAAKMGAFQTAHPWVKEALNAISYAASVWCVCRLVYENADSVPWAARKAILLAPLVGAGVGVLSFHLAARVQKPKDFDDLHPIVVVPGLICAAYEYSVRGPSSLFVSLYHAVGLTIGLSAGKFVLMGPEPESEHQQRIRTLISNVRNLRDSSDEGMTFDSPPLRDPL